MRMSFDIYRVYEGKEYFMTRICGTYVQMVELIRILNETRRTSDTSYKGVPTEHQMIG